MKDINTRPATQEDKEFVWQLRRLCYRDVVIRQFGQWDDAWQAEHFERTWQPEACRIVLRQGAPVGLLSVWQEEDSLFLSQVLVHPDHQNQGIGSALVRDVMARAQAMNLPVRLQVLLENTAALRLYQRLGFEVYETTETHQRMAWGGQATVSI